MLNPSSFCEKSLHMILYLRYITFSSILDIRIFKGHVVTDASLSLTHTMQS